MSDGFAATVGCRSRRRSLPASLTMSGGKPMKRNRSLLLLAASAGIVGCGDQASRLLAPTSAAETGSVNTGSSGGGYTWTIKKELVAVHMETSTGTMILD